VFTSLRAGMALWEIARRENCSVRTVRRIVADALTRLEIDPTGLCAIADPRLNDAMLSGAAQAEVGEALDCFTALAMTDRILNRR
jgi:DNA-binding NarL/FixJ family response regulator